MQGVCNASSCDVNDGNGRNCTYASGTLEFFVIASQAWILCLAYDFWVTVTNPMSSSSISRLPKYHAFSWSVASLFTLGITIPRGVAGYWEINNLVDDTAICWVKVESHEDNVDDESGDQKPVINWRTFVFFYIPWYLVLVYVLIIVFRAYGRLKNGITKTFQSRAKLLSLNGLNIGIYVLFWTINVIIYTFAYALPESDQNASRYFWRLTWFFFSSFGFADLLVYLCISDIISVKSEDESTEVDFNAVLREEVLQYATKGIRESAAKRTENVTKDKLVLTMKQTHKNLQSVFVIDSMVKIFLYGEDDSVQGDQGGGDSNAFDIEVTEVEEEMFRSDRLSVSIPTPDIEMQHRGTAATTTASRGNGCILSSLSMCI